MVSWFYLAALLICVDFERMWEISDLRDYHYYLAIRESQFIKNCQCLLVDCFSLVESLIYS